MGMGKKVKICGIYKLENLVNGKVYIGQSVDIEKRWKMHQWASTQETYNNNIIYRAILKYGWDNFSKEILEEVNEEELNQKEIYYIKKFNSYIGYKNNWGYNMTIGGGATTGLICSVETRKKISESQKGHKIKESTKQIWRAHKKGFKPVAQYDLNGNLIKIYDCITDATHDGYDRDGIGKCCSSKQQTANKYMWKFVEDGNILLNIEPRERTIIQGSKRVVNCYSLKGEYITNYNTIMDAEYATLVKACNIVLCCQGKYLKAGSYIWTYADDEKDIKETVCRIHKSTVRKKPVIQYDLANNFIRRFDSISEIEKNAGFARKGIKNCCYGKQETSNGYKWKYEEDIL